jgi:hypothetical protein
VPWRNSQALVADVDKLPHGPGWSVESLVVGEGSRKRTVSLYKRPIIDVIRELIGNPRFRDFMRYAPERHWTTGACKTRVYSEMWTGEWWWRRQVSMCIRVLKQDRH